MARSSHLHVWGSLVRFEPLADVTRGMVEPGALSAASSVQRVQERRWHQAWTQARSSSILRVSVLGGSVACGGGAAFPSSEADLGGSWVRRMADVLKDELAAAIDGAEPTELVGEFIEETFTSGEGKRQQPSLSREEREKAVGRETEEQLDT